MTGAPSARPAWHAESAGEVVARLATDAARGLDADAVATHPAHAGPNTIGARRDEPWWEELAESLREPLQLLLIAVGVAGGMS